MIRFPGITIDKKSAARVGRGHRWIFSNEVTNADASASTASQVAVFSPEKEFFGSAIYNHNALVRARIYSNKSEAFDEELIAARIAAAAARRERLLPGRRSCRLVFSESDGLPGLIVDRYESVLSIQTLTRAVDDKKQAICDMLMKLPGVEAIVERNDSHAREYENLPQQKGVLRGTPPDVIPVSFNDIQFNVDIMAGQKTGMYLDQVENWTLTKPFVQGKRVLDLFCNAGGFGLHAARYGAANVRAIDNSDEALSRTMFNANANGIENIKAKKSDAFLYVRSRPEEFDVIVCDPPPFARSIKQLKNAVRGYRELNRHCLKMLTPGGVLLTFSCSAAISGEEFDKTLLLSAKDAGRNVRILPGGGQPIDHAPLLAMPETQYLKARILEAVD